MCNSKDEQNVDKPLQDFDALFRNQQEQQSHVHTVHNGAANIEFTSVWDKKEASNGIMPSVSHSPSLIGQQTTDPLKYGNMPNYQYYQSYPAMPYQPYYRQTTDPYTQNPFGFNHQHHFPSQSTGHSIGTNQDSTTSTADTGYDFYQNQNVQPTYHAQTSVTPSTSVPKSEQQVQQQHQQMPKFDKCLAKTSVTVAAAVETSAAATSMKKNTDNKDKKCDEKVEKGKPRYNSIVFANEF